MLRPSEDRLSIDERMHARSNDLSLQAGAASVYPRQIQVLYNLLTFIFAMIFICMLRVKISDYEALA